MITLQDLRPDNWHDVRKIYLQGIATGQATFETAAPGWEQWDKGHLQSLRYIAMIDNQVCGWAALSPVSGRCVYGGVAEVSVYVHEDFRRQRVGHKLLENLIIESEKQGLWTLQAGIFPENLGSIRLHETLGFRFIGYREKVGKMNGVWRNVNLYERRSKTI
jgi:L-amino acid N-acyltransferase YncA